MITHKVEIKSTSMDAFEIFNLLLMNFKALK